MNGCANELSDNSFNGKSKQLPRVEYNLIEKKKRFLAAFLFGFFCCVFFFSFAIFFAF